MTAIDFGKKSLIVITGASKGIGRTISVELARNLNQHSIIILLARSLKELEETSKLIEEIDKSLTVINRVIDLSTCDLTILQQLFDDMLRQIDTNDIEFGLIFHNAGSTGDVKQTTDLVDYNNWLNHFNLNLFSTSLLNSVFIKKFRSIARQLVVINITSLCGRTPFKNLSMYGTSKAAREIFFKVLALEEPGIIVLNYSPGPVQTQMFDGIIENAQSEEVKNNFQEIKDSTILTPEQTVAKLLTFLETGNFKSGDTVDYFDRI